MSGRSARGDGRVTATVTLTDHGHEIHEKHAVLQRLVVLGEHWIEARAAGRDTEAIDRDMRDIQEALLALEVIA
jgi:hypothetical protein